MNTKIVSIKEYSNKEVGLFVQVILTELLIIFSIVSIVSKAFMPTFYAIITMLMFCMAYNNKKFYKKKYMTVVYIILGLFVGITTIVEYIF